MHPFVVSVVVVALTKASCSAARLRPVKRARRTALVSRVVLLGLASLLAALVFGLVRLARKWIV
jgi:hypothetical protein